MGTKIRCVAVVAAVFALGAGAPSAENKDGSKSARPRVQIALLLDTSNSMDGLIAQAKTQLWKVVNEFATAKRGGVRPDLRIALYEYDKSSLPASQGYIRQVVPLTEDLDKVSEELFALKTNGGQEYCGQVISRATEELAWSKSNADLKLVFIAGNEPFTQGPVDFRKAVKAAITNGIVVNTIFCGRAAEGERTGWKEGAVLADGRYMNIDHNRAVAAVVAPQDAELARLSAEMNRTYVPYGRGGMESSARQRTQDLNAASAAPAAAAERAVSKASSFYSNSGWDLVDATRNGQVALDSVQDAELPEEMRTLDAAGRKAYLEGKAKERAELQRKIGTLNVERQKHIATEQAKNAKAGEDTLDSAMIKTVREQAEKAQYTFE